jgi:hypothetical protein
MTRRTVLSLLCAVAGLASLRASAADAPARRAWFTLNPTTMSVKMALPPGIPKEVADKIPGLNGAPKRMLNIGLTSPQTAPNDAKAAVGVPEGLGVGKTVSLQIESLELPKETDRQFKTSYYFGCNTAVPAGQPITYTLDAWTKQVGDLKGSYGAATEPKLMDLPKTVSAKGAYTLTSYAGNVTATIPAELDFLDPVELLSPKPEDPLDVTQPLLVSWNKVPRAKGYLVMAMGMPLGGDQGGVMWWSAGDPKFGMFGMQTRNNVESDVALADRIKRGWYLGPDVTKCSIPAGIFKEGSPVNVSVTALGDEKLITQRYDEATKTNVPLVPAVNISPQSTASVMLGLPGPAGFGGFDGKVPGPGAPDGETPPAPGADNEPPDN